MNEPAKWVRLDIPARFQMGPARMAEVCGWRTRSEGKALLVCLEERYRPSRPRLIMPSRLADAANAANPEAYDRLRSWPPQDEFREPKRQRQADETEADDDHPKTRRVPAPWRLSSVSSRGR